MLQGISQSLPVSFRNQYYKSALSGPIGLNNTTVWFTILSIDVGRTGTFFCYFQACMQDTTGAASLFSRIWDGVQNYASGLVQVSGGAVNLLAVSGIVTNPKGPITAQCIDTTFASGVVSQYSGLGQDTSLRIWRIA